nr:hypothetical protein CFP56_72513 [Quercus suber]
MFTVERRMSSLRMARIQDVLASKQRCKNEQFSEVKVSRMTTALELLPSDANNAASRVNMDGQGISKTFKGTVDETMNRGVIVSYIRRSKSLNIVPFQIPRISRCPKIPIIQDPS